MTVSNNILSLVSRCAHFTYFFEYNNKNASYRTDRLTFVYVFYFVARLRLKFKSPRALSADFLLVTKTALG